MKPYKRHVMQGDLKILEPLAETAGYSINDGDPQAYMRLDRGSAGTRHRLGIWRCTSGTFTCTEKGDELQTLLEVLLHTGEFEGLTQEKNAANLYTLMLRTIETQRTLHFSDQTAQDRLHHTKELFRLL